MGLPIIPILTDMKIRCYDLTGNVIYPVCRVVNKEADEAQTEAAEDFRKFIISDEAKEVFESYYFDTDVE